MTDNQEQFKNYRLGEIIGRGRFAVVYKAEKLDVRKTVALKVLNPEFASRTDIRDQFREQAKQQAKVTHPRIVRVEDLREEHGQFFVAMEYMPLGSLRSWVTQNGMLSFRQAAILIEDAAEGLDYLHGRSLVHGDVKPGNILLMDDPNQKGMLRAKLSDLRLPLASEISQTLSENLVVLTPEYISPEQASGGLATPLSDQYVLGVVTYEMLCGQPPFTSKSQVDLYIDHQKTRPTSLQQLNSQVTQDLEQVVMKALEKAPENRYASCGEFARALRAATAATEQKRFADLLVSAQRLLEKQEFEQARVALKDALLIQPEHEKATQLMTRLEQQEGLSKNYKQAADSLELANAKANAIRKAVPNDPDDAGLLKTFAPPPPPLWKQLTERWRSAEQLAGVLLLLGVICIGSFTAWIDIAADQSIQPTIVAINRTSTPTFTPTPTPTFTPTLTPTFTPTLTPTQTPTLIGGGSGKIAFVSARGGNKEIYVMNPDGSGQINLTKNNASEDYPTWSPDGRKIMFVSNRDGNNEIYVMNANGSVLTNLTKNGANDHAPSWSPNGNKIAFFSDRSRGTQIFVMNANGDEPMQLTNSDRGNDWGLSWSPDNSKIAFPSYYDTYVVNVNGSEPQKLTNTRQYNWNVSWSPDGKKLVYSLGESDYNDIYVINADGINRVNLTKDKPNTSNSPAWSPDGKKILFVSKRNGNDEIYIMDADSDNIINLTKDSSKDFSPVWSPDGRKIAFVSDRDGNKEIYIMNADGSNPIRLTNNDADNTDPVWSP